MRLPHVVLIVVVTYSSVLVPPAWSQPPPDMQLTAAAATILYFPFKAAFALGGGLVGGLVYVFSGLCETTAKSIWIPSIYGTYIITPAHLSRDRPIRFLGIEPEFGWMPAPEPGQTAERAEAGAHGTHTFTVTYPREKSSWRKNAPILGVDVPLQPEKNSARTNAE